MPNHYYVFFAADDGTGHALYRWIRRLTQSDVVHVSFGDRDVVINPTHRRNQVWARTAYSNGAKGLHSVVHVKCEKTIDLARFERSSPRRYWPSVLRWATFGVTPANNCVTETVSALREAGLRVPRRMVSASQLLDWLREEGHDFALFRDRPIEAARPDRGA